MIDIIGLIKVNEQDPERIKYLIACIRSYSFLKEKCRFILGLETPSDALYDLVEDELKGIDYNYQLLKIPQLTERNSYGKQYVRLLHEAKSNYTINFMEDQFMLIDSLFDFARILQTMLIYSVDVCKAAFLKIEQNSSKGIKFISDTSYGKIFNNDDIAYFHYQKHYGKRFYIGVNFITSVDFAYDFWKRDMGTRPHEYEISEPHQFQDHVCMIPKIEIQAAINDDHGEPGTCLLARKEEKWLKVWAGCKDIVLPKNRNGINFHEGNYKESGIENQESETGNQKDKMADKPVPLTEYQKSLLDAAGKAGTSTIAFDAKESSLKDENPEIEVEVDLSDWTIPDSKGCINVPDELDELFNSVAMQLRFHTISGKNEVMTVAHIVSNAEKFFRKKYETLPVALEAKGDHHNPETTA